MSAPSLTAKLGVAMVVVLREVWSGTWAARPRTDTGKPGGTRIVGQGNVCDIDVRADRGRDGSWAGWSVNTAEYPPTHVIWRIQ